MSRLTKDQIGLKSSERFVITQSFMLNLFRATAFLTYTHGAFLSVFFFSDAITCSDIVQGLKAAAKSYNVPNLKKTCQRAPCSTLRFVEKVNKVVALTIEILAVDADKPGSQTWRIELESEVRRIATLNELLLRSYVNGKSPTWYNDIHLSLDGEVSTMRLLQREDLHVCFLYWKCIFRVTLNRRNQNRKSEAREGE